MIVKDLNAKECNNIIAQHLSAISQEFIPISIQVLPDSVKFKVQNSHSEKVPKVQPYEDLENLKKHKFKLSSIPGDIPPKLKRKFYVELATPVANIFNSITTTGEYPRQWVREFVTPIPKVENVESQSEKHLIDHGPFQGL